MWVSCFQLLKFPNSALRFISVGVSAHCVPSSTICITRNSYPAEVAKTQHENFGNFGISLQRYHDNSSTDISSTTLRLQTFRLHIFLLLLFSLLKYKLD